MRIGLRRVALLSKSYNLVRRGLPVSKVAVKEYYLFIKCFKTDDGYSLNFIRLAMFLIYYKLQVISLVPPSFLLQSPQFIILGKTLIVAFESLQELFPSQLEMMR